MGSTPSQSAIDRRVRSQMALGNEEANKERNPSFSRGRVNVECVLSVGGGGGGGGGGGRKVEKVEGEGGVEGNLRSLG